MSFLLKPLAFISASAISLLGLVSTRSKKARYYFHLTLYFSTMGVCSVLGVVYSIALSLVGQVSWGGAADHCAAFVLKPELPISPSLPLLSSSPHPHELRPPQRLNINYLTARSFYYLCYPLIGIKLEVEGREHLDGLMTLGENGKAQSAVLVGNHQR
jgi:lysophosphatidate acyltransferase